MPILCIIIIIHYFKRVGVYERPIVAGEIKISVAYIAEHVCVLLIRGNPCVSHCVLYSPPAVVYNAIPVKHEMLNHPL